MKRHKIIRKIVTLVLFLILLLFNVELLRCESESGPLKEQYQAKYTVGRAEEINDPELQDDKNGRFKVLEWIIRQHLMKKYEKLEEEDQEDNLD